MVDPLPIYILSLSLTYPSSDETAKFFHRETDHWQFGSVEMEDFDGYCKECDEGQRQTPRRPGETGKSDRHFSVCGLRWGRGRGEILWKRLTSEKKIGKKNNKVDWRGLKKKHYEERLRTERNKE